MRTVKIKADLFFEFLKSRNTSMWEMFEEMIDGEEKQLLFLNSEDKIIADYILPKTKEELQKDVETFKADLVSKLSRN